MSLDGRFNLSNQTQSNGAVSLTTVNKFDKLFRLRAPCFVNTIHDLTADHYHNYPDCGDRFAKGIWRHRCIDSQANLNASERTAGSEVLTADLTGPIPIDIRVGRITCLGHVKHKYPSSHPFSSRTGFTHDKVGCPLARLVPKSLCVNSFQTLNHPSCRVCTPDDRVLVSRPSPMASFTARHLDAKGRPRRAAFASALASSLATNFI